MKKIAIIPARGGSKRIPRKNIRPFLGKPVISYSIDAAISSGLFDEVMVSTDDEEIRDIAVSYGATVPFMRSEKTANDYALIAEVIDEVLSMYIKSGKSYDYFCCIFATAPLISNRRLSEAFNLMVEKGYDSVFPVVRFGYPIQRALKIENNKVEMIWPENYSKRSQDLRQCYFDSGQFYWMKTGAFLEKKRIFTDNSGSLVFEEMEVQDIDNETDWELAKLKFKLLYDK